jgi:hypothetical protein
VISILTANGPFRQNKVNHGDEQNSSGNRDRTK